MKKVLLSALLLTGMAPAFSQTPGVDNPGFEEWEDYTSGMLELERPQEWYGSDGMVAEIAPLAIFLGIDIDEQQQVFRSEDKHSGSYAARLVTKNLGDTLGNVPAVLANAQISIDFTAVMEDGGDVSSVIDHAMFNGGMPMYGFKADTVSAWVKTPDGNADSSAMMVTAMRKTTTSGGADTMVAIGSVTHVIAPSGGEWRQVVFNMEYDGEVTATDTLIIVFMSSRVTSSEETATEGNTLIVDDVSVTYAEGAVSVKEPAMNAGKIIVFPNPATSSVTFDIDVNMPAVGYSLNIFNVSGKKMYDRKITDQLNSVNIGSWPPGTYFYQVKNTSGKFSAGTFVK